MKQMAFSFFASSKTSFGGSELLGKRKALRPLSTKLPVHLILKSEGQRTFAPDNERLSKLILRMAKKFHITIQSQAINWTHIHFLIQIKARKDYVRFIRSLTSRLALAAIKANVKSGKSKLFSLRPFTRIVTWGRDLKNVIQYIYKNELESRGLLRRKKKSKQAKKSRNRQEQE